MKYGEKRHAQYVKKIPTSCIYCVWLFSLIKKIFRWVNNDVILKRKLAMIVKRKKENVFEIGENINVGYCHVLYRTGWRYYCALKYNNLPFLRLCLVCNIIQLSKCVKCKNDKRQQFVVCFLHFSCHSKVVFY